MRDRLHNAAPLLTLDPLAPDSKLIEEAAEELRAGHILVIPTDTVYGIAQIASDATRPENLRSVKQRPEEKSIPLLIANRHDLEHYSKELPSYARELAARHWPGALTLVVRASDRLPQQFVAEDDSIALRMPAHAIALALLEAVAAPLACSSANLSGKAPATDIKELDPQIAQRVSLIVDGGKLSGGVASTVVSCLGAEPCVLRPGPVVL